jgi:hypothetical protein
MYWLSGRTRNDLFLLYCFADSGRPTTELRALVARRSARIADLRVRLREVPGNLDYPSWTPCDFAAEQFVEHALPEANWPSVSNALGKLLSTGVDAAGRPWRLHVFRGVLGAPGQLSDGEPATVVVLQMSHALADGVRGAHIARELFAEPAAVGAGGVGHPPKADSAVRAAEMVQTPRPMPESAGQAPGVVQTSGPTSDSAVYAAEAVPTLRSTSDPVHAGLEMAREQVGQCRYPFLPSATPTWASALTDSALGLLRMPIQLTRTALRGYHAYRAQQELAELTAAGQLPSPGTDLAPSLVNRPIAVEAPGHVARMLVRDAGPLRGTDWTVTVVVLTAISIALPRYLESRGEPVDRLGAQVPMALAGPQSAARNNYRSLGVDLFIGEPDLRVRAGKIAAALSDRRIRAQHPLLAAQDRVTAVVPAPLLRRDIDCYPIDTVPDSIAGHTVVSSVYRGPADLTFGGGRVLFTAGFPAIGAVMNLTHGVHGIGDTITISVHADASVLPDIDIYTGLLDTALREVAAADGYA